MRDGITNALQVQLRKYMDGETRSFYYTTIQIVDSFFMPSIQIIFEDLRECLQTPRVFNTTLFQGLVIRLLKKHKRIPLKSLFRIQLLL